MVNIKSVIDHTDDKAQYDEYAKRLLSMKPVLAWILIHTIDEFAGMDPNEVVSLIEGDISIGSTLVEPGYTNEKDDSGNLIITGMNTESRVINEGTRFFDILFYVCTAGRRSKIIVNIEAQKDEPYEYDVEMRGIYYSSRELSSELGRDFSGDDYNSMLKVYSIWICMNNSEDSMVRIHLTPDIIWGDPRWKEQYDLSNTVIIRIKNNLNNDPCHPLHRLLGALFARGLMPKEREDILEHEFGIQIEEEMINMCNLGQGIWEQGLKEGIEQGIALGQQQGVEQGIQQGIIQSVRKLLDYGMSDATIMNILQVTNDQITEAKAM